MLHVEHLWMDGCEYSRRTPMVAWSAQSLYAILLWFTYIYMLHVRSSCQPRFLLHHQKVKLGRFYAFFSFLWFFFDLRRRRRNARPPMPQYYKAPMHYSPKKCWDRQELLDGNPQNIYPLYSIILKRNRIKFLQNDQIFSIFCSKLLSLKSL